MHTTATLMIQTLIPMNAATRVLLEFAGREFVGVVAGGSMSCLRINVVSQPPTPATMMMAGKGMAKSTSPMNETPAIMHMAGEESCRLPIRTSA
jgi:hypothetical protein